MNEADYIRQLEFTLFAALKQLQEYSPNEQVIFRSPNLNVNYNIAEVLAELTKDKEVFKV